MGKTIIAFLFLFVLVASFAVVLADNETDQNKTDKNETAKNMTYGQCVSQNAIIKNTCYASVKANFSSCKNTTDAKQCNTDYKKDMTQCKATFKATKKGECGKIKANWLEKARYAFA